MHRRNRRSHGRWTAATAVIAAVLAAATPLVVHHGLPYADAATNAEEPAFPRPGGGSQAIHAYTPLNGDHSYLLDTATGEYQRLPYPNAVLSPDRRLVAVDADGRIGVANRRALLHAGEEVVRWTSLPGGSPAWWSPDGRALLVTTLDKDTGMFTAHRYDLATGRVRQTPIALDCEICIAGWAADSVRYVVMLRSPDPEVLEGPSQYLHPDGTPGRLVGARGIIPDGDAYSPTRRYVIVEPARPVMDPPPPAVFDLGRRDQ